MNDQKQFGNKFMVAVSEANTYGVAPEIVSDCMLRAAHICLSRSLPSAAEAKLRKELRESFFTFTFVFVCVCFLFIFVLVFLCCCVVVLLLFLFCCVFVCLGCLVKPKYSGKSTKSSRI